MPPETRRSTSCLYCSSKAEQLQMHVKSSVHSLRTAQNSSSTPAHQTADEQESRRIVSGVRRVDIAVQVSHPHHAERPLFSGGGCLRQNSTALTDFQRIRSVHAETKACKEMWQRSWATGAEKRCRVPVRWRKTECGSTCRENPCIHSA